MAPSSSLQSRNSFRLTIPSDASFRTLSLDAAIGVDKAEVLPAGDGIASTSAFLRAVTVWNLAAGAQRRQPNGRREDEQMPVLLNFTRKR